MSKKTTNATNSIHKAILIIMLPFSIATVTSCAKESLTDTPSNNGTESGQEVYRHVQALYNPTSNLVPTDTIRYYVDQGYHVRLCMGQIDLRFYYDDSLLNLCGKMCAQKNVSPDNVSFLGAAYVKNSTDSSILRPVVGPEQNFTISIKPINDTNISALSSTTSPARKFVSKYYTNYTR